MLITRVKAKQLLNISVSDHDDYIDILLPQIEQSICDICRNDFVNQTYDFFSSNKISFISSNNSINMTGIGNKGLSVNDTIRVYKSLKNDQTFTIDTVNTDSLILNDIDDVSDEGEEETIYITLIKYPKPLQLIASKMLQYNLTEEENNNLGIKEEKIDDYTVKYSEESHGYSKSIIDKLQPYKQVYHLDLFESWGFSYGNF